MQLKYVLAQCAIAASLGVTAPVALAAPSQPVAAEHTALASTPAESQAVQPRDEAAQYAQREQQQPKAAQFRGGDTVVIAMSSGAVIIAVILLVLLL